MTNQELIQNCADLLGIEKIAWSRTMRDLKRCKQDGFTEDDIILAASNMSKTDAQYHSMYSLFNKIDYWMSRVDYGTLPKGSW